MAGERQLNGNRDWKYMSRAGQKAALNLGVIQGGVSTGHVPKFRSNKLELLDAYYENRQYAHLPKWDASDCNMGEDSYVPVRKRQPRIKFNFSKILCQRVAAKLVGSDTFPTMQVEDDPDTQLFLSSVMRVSHFKSRILEPVRRTLASGSALVRFYIVNGSTKIEHFLGKYCYPEFNEAGELSSVRIQYVYEDPKEKDEQGKPLEKWYRLDLSESVDTLYDNPVYKPNAQPDFTVASQTAHNLGYVQAQWFRTSEDKHSPDGYALTDDILDFIDELCYSLSQSSQAIGYNQDPQLALKGMDVDGIDNLIRSSAKAWNMGRDGEAEFLESSLNGVTVAKDNREEITKKACDLARIVFLDPEKFASNAQSGKAMEMLHGPLVELVNELRPVFEPLLITLLVKIAMTLLIVSNSGVDIGIDIPPGWTPQSLNVMAVWPPIFPMTITDLKEKVGVASAATTANLISRETGTRWLAKDFGIEDVEEEIAKINAQPVINPFGGF